MLCCFDFYCVFGHRPIDWLRFRWWSYFYVLGARLNDTLGNRKLWDWNLDFPRFYIRNNIEISVGGSIINIALSLFCFKMVLEDCSLFQYYCWICRTDNDFLQYRWGSLNLDHIITVRTMKWWININIKICFLLFCINRLLLFFSIPSTSIDNPSFELFFSHIYNTQFWISIFHYLIDSEPNFPIMIPKEISLLAIGKINYMRHLLPNLKYWWKCLISGWYILKSNLESTRNILKNMIKRQ